MNDLEESRTERGLRVVHLASGDLWGGAEAQLYALAKELNRSAEISLYVILLNHGILEQRLMGQQISVTVFDESKLNGFQILRKLPRFLRDIRPDIVHTHRQKENVIGSLAALLVGNCKSIRTVHGAAEVTLKPWQVYKMIYRLLDWFCGRFLQDRIVGVSDELATLLTKRFTRVKAIHNGVDVGELAIQSQLPVDIPGRNDAFKIAFIGRLVDVKRPGMFIEMAGQLVSEDKDRYDFYVLGDGPLRDKVEMQIRQLKIGSYVHMMGFTMHLPAHLARMNALVVTSDHEGLPVTLLEALSLGIPVVAHAVGSIPRVLEHGRYGILVREQEAAKYAGAIRSCVADKYATRHLVKRGSAHVANCYSSRRTASAYLKLYRDLLA
jgi:glycosyltransferase involved in cell wall biosynthesis